MCIRDRNKKELTEHFASEDNIFICIESFLRQRPANLLVEALENTVLYGIPHDPLLALCAEDYEIAVSYTHLKAGGYKHFPLFEDYYLWVRMLMAGARFYNIQESLLFFRFSPDMFKRRGGWRYAVTEVKLQILFYRIGFIDFFSLIRNICIRLVTRLLPNDFRSLLYKRFIRN